MDRKEYHKPSKQMPRHDKQEIHVSAPGAGPWAVGSTQACSWWSNNIKSDAKVVVEIKSTSSDKAECGTGTLMFKIGSDWDTSESYYAYVYLKEDETCHGKGGEFKLIGSYGYGYGEKKDDYKSDDYSKKTY
ncbi:3252_t:CDS:2 [Dentiscutata erythropus]|uniref:3252_t:CDS:1 n=1 Tax=Dentiscutata erythropus TaxID=1348616 RepID=A0A9N9D936_9GLOM|nr:3252_t:CDS:2 [Dentiscutata erythropus]